ncbi:MAG: hypothetical protein ACT6XY_02560 [Phreatobacter sp.]|jgi:uncharacterized protein YigA (DUF484 family)|uniref:hypothetical protein n=1 Tax=Phreatobacter sp. TaxID=1966341 RepID=UPI004035EA28
MHGKKTPRTAAIIQQSKTNLHTFASLIEHVNDLRKATLHGDMADDLQVALAANFSAAMEHLLLANLQYATWAIGEVRDSVDLIAVGPTQQIELGPCLTDANSPCRTISFTAALARRNKPLN